MDIRTISESQIKLWSDNPNAPEIPYPLYFEEKAYFSGILVGSILYGIVIVLFFKCVAALLDPANRRGERVKWGLVSYTAIMFSFVTLQTALALHAESICYIDDREFPGIEGAAPPGPLGYAGLINHKALTIVPNITFYLNGWLADGLLLYRCYVIYSKNFWVITFPCLMYLGSLVMGIMYIYQTSETYSPISDWAALPYYWITLSLNVLLTLMIVVQLILHTRNTRTALGIAGIGRLCKAIVTMLVESCALYAASLALIIGGRTARSPIMALFTCIIPGAQVIASLLIIQRVANKSALTSNTVASGHLSSFKIGNQEQLTGGGVLDGCPMGSADRHGADSAELGDGVRTTTDFHPGEFSEPSESDPSHSRDCSPL